MRFLISAAYYLAIGVVIYLLVTTFRTPKEDLGIMFLFCIPGLLIPFLDIISKKINKRMMREMGLTEEGDEKTEDKSSTGNAD